MVMLCDSLMAFIKGKREAGEASFSRKVAINLVDVLN